MKCVIYLNGIPIEIVLLIFIVVILVSVKSAGIRILASKIRLRPTVVPVNAVWQILKYTANVHITRHFSS